VFYRVDGLSGGNMRKSNLVEQFCGVEGDFFEAFLILIFTRKSGPCIG